MLRNTAIWMTLLAALAFAGCSSRQGDRLSESDYPYTGPPSEDNGANGRYASSEANPSGTRYATARERSYRPGGTDYYGRLAYSYGRDPSYDYDLVSNDDDYGDDDAYGYGYPEEVGYFYDELDPYGDWYQDAHYGWVWAPEYVSAGWRPYLYGHWVYTDWGWAWVSDDPWGADTYHYGRWNCDASNRWFWIPDDVWGPAWVSWRYGDGWAGWAPLPPEATWNVTFGLRYSDRFIDASRWCFVPDSRLTSTRLRTYVAPLRETRRIYRGTRDYTRYAMVGGRAAERGLRPALIERRTGRDIPQYRLETRESGLRRDMVRGRTLVSPMPVLSRGGSRGRADRVTREMRVRQERFTRGMRTRQGRSDREQVVRGRAGSGRDQALRGRVGSDREQAQRGRQRIDQERARGRIDRGQAVREQRFERERAQSRARDVREERVRRDRAVQEQQQFDRRQQQQQQQYERQQQQRGYERQQQQRYERRQQQRGRSEEGRIQRQRSDVENRGRAEQQARQEAEQAQYQRRAQARQQAEQARSERQQAQRQQGQQGQQRKEARGRQEQQQQEQPSTQEDRGSQQDPDQRGHGRGRGHNR